MLSSKHVLITGGNGFIGAHLARRCVALGAKVAVLSHHAGGNWRLKDIEDKIEMFIGSVADSKVVAPLVKNFKPEIVFHLAASINRDRSLAIFSDLYHTNVEGTEVLLASLLGASFLKRFVQIGTIDEYGSNQAPFKETDRELPMSPYSLTKLMANRLVEYASWEEKFPAVIVRPALVYGPAQSFGMLVTECIKSCLAGETLPMTPGEQSRDLLYVDDMVEALIQAGTVDKAIGEVINIGSGEEVVIKKVVLTINELLGNKGDIQFGKLPYRPGENIHFWLETKKARRILNWQPRVSLLDGLQTTVEWYKENQKRFPDLQPRR